MADTVTGILKRLSKGQFAVRTAKRSYRPAGSEIVVRPDLAQRFVLTQGATVTGQTERKKGKKRLVSIESVGGMSPEDFGKRPRFTDLVAIDPHERFGLGASGAESMRIVDLSPQSRIIVLLVDERPEEVTHFRRSVEGAEIVASTSDHSANEHVELAELMLAHVQAELECGREIVLLIDSLTRIGRAFNNMTRRRGAPRRQTMSGGLEAGILEIPRRLFGLARNVENGGSVTIIATCLINTGSRMDQLIFEEFKGTGHSEIVLDRSLAEARIFPAIDIPASGTRKEAKLYSDDHTRGLATLRRVLSNYGTRDAMGSLFKLLEKYPDNAEFLQSMCASA
jgi:transcription termination factor Rho